MIITLNASLGLIAYTGQQLHCVPWHANICWRQTYKYMHDCANLALRIVRLKFEVFPDMIGPFITKR